MKIIFIEYPKCSTCQKAKKWLESNNIEFEDRHIVEETPTIKELQKWIPTSNKEIKNWFNTSGLKYKSLNLKEKLQNLLQQECKQDSPEKQVPRVQSARYHSQHIPQRNTKNAA